ncbi:MAG: transcriptional repressor LexA, partial [Chloroflexota bacterium]|nr:transcriptional repressor LexA [Chloroflexota bacterium]
PPSIREIGNKTGITSTSVVNYYLDQLEKKGMIERDRKISRGVRLSGLNSSSDTLRIPILGPIAAGLPLPELDPNVSYMTDSEANAVDIARSLLPAKEKGDNLFALEVKGNSMIDAMINDGDIVVIRPASDARNGEMVAVWLPRDNEATLKYFFKEKDRYRLQPANPTMKPIFIKKSEPLEIKGKVVMVIRKMDKPLAA